jgi:hypothetical protein
MATSVLATTPVPAAKAVRDMLTDLLGRTVEVSSSLPYAPKPGEPTSVAVYVDDRTVVRAVGVVDLGFSARAGAAIGLVPSPTAEDAVGTGLLSETLAENLYEVLNIAASLLNAEGVVHVKLHEMYAAGTRPPVQIAECMQALGRRLDLGVDISGYGKGRFSLVILG